MGVVSIEAGCPTVLPSSEVSEGAYTAVRTALATAARTHGFFGAVYMHLGHGGSGATGGMTARPRRLAASAAFDTAQYIRRGYLAFDPLASRACVSYSPFFWRLAELADGDPDRGRLLGVMAGWGMGEGVVAPVQDYAQGPAFLNFFTRENGAPESGVDHVALMRTAVTVHAEARNLPAVDSHAGEAALTSREMAVLRLAALGRTEKETAQALSLSRRGIQFHLARAIEKLDAPNKTAAVAQAVSSGLIRL